MNREQLGSGFGLLRPQLSNTLAGTPKDVRSVTFAFTCTGNGKATVNVTAGPGSSPSGPSELTCDGSIHQQSVELPKPTSVSYEATISGPQDGSFAYAYYAEKKQLG